MELTKKDRIFLINQYRILSALNPGEAEHYKELISILQDGYKIFYPLIDEWIDEDMPEEEGRFVLNILSLYRAIEDYKRRHGNAEFREEPFQIFRGFDGNNETDYMAFCRFLIETQGKFSEQKAYFSENDNLNSHMPTSDKYRAMLEKWREFDESYNLTKDQVLEIIKAR